MSMSAYENVWETVSVERRQRNARWPWVRPDAPRVPDGLEPKPDVDYGCGSPECRYCYQPETALPKRAIRL